MKVGIPKEMIEAPLIRISVLLTISIITATYSYDNLGTSQWLALTIVSQTASFLTRKLIYSQCLSLYFCLFCLGCTLTAHQIDQSHLPSQYVTYQELSPFDRTLLKAGTFREEVEKKMKDLHFEDQDYAVISAMALGDKTALDKETKDSYAIAGASHVLAISGLHIGIIFQLFLLILGGKRRSLVTIILSTTAIWAYVIFIGMPNSAVRSATMISIYSFALLSRRHPVSLNTLAFAYVMMLFFSPQSLYDISFQMSFLAVLSILLFYPLLNDLFHPRHLFCRRIWQLSCVSAAAQIGTMPLIVYYFGRISCYSLLTNLVAIPAATLILYLSALILILYPISFLSFLASISDTLIHYISRILISITQFANTFFHLVSMLPGASIEGASINLSQLYLLYIVIFSGYLLWWNLHHIFQKWSVKA